MSRDRVGRKVATWTVSALLGLGILVGGALQAGGQAVPADVSYQGLLWLADGSVAPDGPYDLEFSIWSVAQGGTVADWSQDHLAVEVRHGVFDVVLTDADGSLAAALDGGPRYMQTRILAGGGLDGTMLAPRQRIGAAAWALVAERAAEATALAAPPPPPAAAVPSGLILLWTESSQCPPGFELMDGLNAAAGTPLDLQARFPMGATPGSVDPLQPDVAQMGGSERHEHTGRTTSNTNPGSPYPFDYAPNGGSAGVKASTHGHRHDFVLHEEEHLPVFATVLFCRKL